MTIIAGVDIGNASTETAIARINEKGEYIFLESALVDTTGIKGTRQNIHGVIASVKKALEKSSLSIFDIDIININEATPVIGDVAMETITETIITESTMIGHNPNTPGGAGLGIGITINLLDLKQASPDKKYIVIVDESNNFKQAAQSINEAVKNRIDVKGAIVQKDDAVLIYNRLTLKLPIVDEVLHIKKVTVGVLAAIEVAVAGRVIEVLSNPYGIATAFLLDPDETKAVVPIARALIGMRSAVVLKTPKGDVSERKIPAGHIILNGKTQKLSIDVTSGADKIMKGVEHAFPLLDASGESGTNVGGMLERVRQVLSELTEKNKSEIKIKDILAVDTLNPQKVIGGVAEEFAMENAVGLAAMVKSDRLQMKLIADELKKELGVDVVVGGVEADMAILGALTTPGVEKPVAIIDMGAGSTDASIITQNGVTKSVHLAGAGNMVTLLMQTELGLDSFHLAEDIKKYPLAKVESLFHIRHEDGTVEFFHEALSPEVFARVVLVKNKKLIPIPGNIPLEKIKLVRREAKEKVFVTNAIRALKSVTKTGNIREIAFVVLVGGSALDFEIPQIVMNALAHYGVVAGRGNIRGHLGPRNAVATGLVLNYIRQTQKE